MIFSISYSATPEVDEVINYFARKTNIVASHMLSKYYGEDIQEFYIGVILVSEDYLSFFKPKRDKYIKDKISFKDGFEIRLKNEFQIEILLPYDEIIASNNEVAYKIMSKKIIESLDRLHNYKKSFQNLILTNLLMILN